MLAALALAALLTNPVELDWSAPPQCPSRSEVQSRIESYVPDAPSNASVRVDAKVSATVDGWSLSLTTTDSDDHAETRVVVDKDCEGLAEVTAVLTALALSPDGADQEDEEPPAQIVDPAPPVLTPSPPRPIEPTADPPWPPPREIDPRPRPTADRQPLRFGLRVAGGFGIGWLPAGADLGIAATVGRRWWGVELEGQVGLPRQVRLAELGSVGADLFGWALAGRGCGVVPLATRVHLPLCAGLEGGQVRATPVGLENATRATPSWLAALVSPSLRISAHRHVALWLMPELQLGVIRPELDADDGDVRIFVSSIASARIRAGVELVF